MDTGSWIFGGVVSAGVHGVLLAALLAFGTSGRQHAPETEKPSAEPPAQVAEPPAQDVEDPAREASSPQPDEKLPDLPSARVNEYEVRPGDTLSAIAQRVGCSITRLAEVNKSDVRKLSRLRVGQRLILPE